MEFKEKKKLLSILKVNISKLILSYCIKHIHLIQ